MSNASSTPDAAIQNDSGTNTQAIMASWRNAASLRHAALMPSME